MQDVKKILDGADMNQDIHQLIGYVWTFNPNEEFPSSHMAELAAEFLCKYQCKMMGSPLPDKDGCGHHGLHYEKRICYSQGCTPVDPRAALNADDDLRERMEDASRVPGNMAGPVDTPRNLNDMLDKPSSGIIEGMCFDSEQPSAPIVRTCARCKQIIPHGMRIYSEKGEWVCDDCEQKAIAPEHVLLSTLAEECGNEERVRKWSRTLREEVELDVDGEWRTPKQHTCTRHLVIGTLSHFRVPLAIANEFRAEVAQHARDVAAFIANDSTLSSPNCTKCGKPMIRFGRADTGGWTCEKCDYQRVLGLGEKLRKGDLFMVKGGNT
jgi:ribosomal protein L37AE/L43A